MKPSRIAIAGAVALVFVVGLAAGRWTVGPDPPQESVVTTSAAIAPAPPVPAPRSASARPGDRAVAAAASAMTVLARPELLFDKAKRRAVVADITVPAYRIELQALFDRGYDYMGGQLGAKGREGVVMSLVPLRYRIESLSRSTATVAVWQVLFLGAPGGRVTASWSTSRARLQLVSGRWLVARFEPDEPGPGPAITNLQTSTPPEIFRARLDGLRPFVP